MTANKKINANQIDKEILYKLKRHNILASDTQHITIKELKDIAKARGMNGYSKKSIKDLADYIIDDISIIKSDIQETKSAIKGFAKQYTIDAGDRPIDYVSFLNIVKPQVTDFLSSIRQTKVNFVLWCIAERIEVSTGEVTQTADCLFLSKREVILDATDVNEVYKKAIDKIMESTAEFLKNGSGWRLKTL